VLSATQGVTATTIRVGITHVNVRGAAPGPWRQHQLRQRPGRLQCPERQRQRTRGHQWPQDRPLHRRGESCGHGTCRHRLHAADRRRRRLRGHRSLKAACYLERNVAVVGSIYPLGRSPTAAEDFSPTAPAMALDPLELSAFHK
jgi:hypothetical protein